MSDITISIARDFTKTPGARLKTDGEYSGEEFREKFLDPLFNDPKDARTIEIILDGVEGYATSFLDEAFGGLARKYGKERCLKRLQFTSVEDPLLTEEITSYISESNG